MNLRARQSRFALMSAHLIVAAYDLGYEVTLGHAMRCNDCRVGREHSLHKLKLAIDLNLFKDGRYLATTDDHRQLGELWESWGGTWGGRFNDGNHYSLEYNGMK